MTRFLHLFLFSFLVPTAVLADGNELSQAQLRDAVAEKGAIPARQVIAGVEVNAGGRVIDLRAFLVEEKLTYRILVRNDDGFVHVMLVDGMTGHSVGGNSSLGQRILKLAGSTH